MGFFDFDIHDETPERAALHDISGDEGKTWTTQWLTPTVVLQHRLNGYITRPYSTDKTIRLYPGNSATPIMITIGVPQSRDAEEYIDEYLDGLLSDFVRYNCDWDFI